MVRAVVTDLDNTLYSWVNYIVPALEAMVDSLCATTGFPRIRVVQSLKQVYERAGTNDYAFAIQESPIFREFQSDFDSFNALVIEPAKEAFARARNRYLLLYPGVVDGLQKLRERGIKIIGLTDSPRNSAEARVRALGLDQHLDALYTLPGYPLPEWVDERIRLKDQEGGYRLDIPVTELTLACEKPSSQGLLQALAAHGLSPAESLVVGDNLAKDGGTARAAGCRFVWAEYGTYIPREYRERLDVLSARTVTRRHLAGPEDPKFEPDWSISNFRYVADLATKA